MDEHRRRAGSTRGLRHRLLELGGHAARGVRRIDIPTRTVWTIARIMLSGPDDLPNVAALQGRMQLMPLSAYPAGLAAAPEGSYSPENDFVPVQKVLAMTPQEFFDTANR